MLGNVQLGREEELSEELAYHCCAAVGDPGVSSSPTPWNLIYLFLREGKQSREIHVLQVDLR